MPSLTASVRGVDDLLVDLDTAADVLRAGMPEARVVTAPRDTGYLADHTAARGPEVVSAAPYAVFVHARNPYLTKAAARVEDTGTAVYAKHLDDLVERIER